MYIDNNIFCKNIGVNFGIIYNKDYAIEIMKILY